MRTSTIFIRTFLCLALGLMGLGLNAQTIITIDNNPNSTTTFQTIQDAHDAANPGDIIYVQPSANTYGSVTIEKPLTIVGRSHNEIGRISQLTSISIKSSSVLIKGIRFSSFSTPFNSPPQALPYVGLEIYECEFGSGSLGQSGSIGVTANIEDVQIRGNLFSSINTLSDTADVLISNNIITSGLTSYNTTSMVITNNIFRVAGGNAFLTNQDSFGTLIVFNNMFIFNTPSDTRQITLSAGDFNLTNNLIYNYGTGISPTFVPSGAATFLETNTLFDTDPLFNNVDSTSGQSFAGNTTYNPETRLEDDLTLQAGSPALTGGGGGSELGLFNNGFNYKYLGNPRDIPTLDITSYDGAVPANGVINVTVKAKAN